MEESTVVTEPKKRAPLSDEHKQKMKEGRERAQLEKKKKKEERTY